MEKVSNSLSVPKKNLFGIEYAIMCYDDAVLTIAEYCSRHAPFAVCFTPVHGLVDSQRDVALRLALQRADLVFPDGQPIRWALNYFHNAGLIDRVYGPDLVDKLLLYMSTNSANTRVYLYGGKSPQVLVDLTQKIEDRYPNVTICGTYREPLMGNITLTPEQVNTTQPHLVLVGLGCPVQEKWISTNAEYLDAPSLGVGAAFSLLSGSMKKAPKAMQDMGLEWLFRLLLEPKRLGWRYFRTNTIYIFLIAKKIVMRLVKRHINAN